MKKLFTILLAGILVSCTGQAQETTIDRFAQLYPTSGCNDLPQGKQRRKCILDVYDHVKSSKNLTPEEELTDEIVNLIKSNTPQQNRTVHKCWKANSCKEADQKRCNVKCLQCRKSCF